MTEAAVPSFATLPADRLETLLELIDIPAPSGFEEAASLAFQRAAEGFAETRVDGVGNTFATVNAGAGRRLALSGHLDEIGVIVTKIDDDGFLRCTGIGGWDVAVLVGQRLRIITRDGSVVPGTIGRGAIHQIEPDNRTKVPKLKDLWIDIGAEDGDDARSKVQVGDYAVIDVTPQRLGEYRLVSRSLDDRVGAFIALEVARRTVGMTGVEVVAVGSAREEVGAIGALTAAYGLQPDVAVALDVTATSDTPAALEAGDFSLGKGPIIARGATTSLEVTAKLTELARANDIPHQLRGIGIRTATDADAIARSGSGVPVGLLSIPCRYLHTPIEQVDLRDVEATIALLVAFVQAGA